MIGVNLYYEVPSESSFLHLNFVLVIKEVHCTDDKI